MTRRLLEVPDLHPAGFQHNGLPGRMRLFKGGDILQWAGDQLDDTPDAFSNPGQALANLDDSVNDVVPGGWGTVAAAAVAVATMGSSLLAEAAVEGGAATVGAVTDAAVTDAAATAAADTAAQAAAAQAAADAAVAQGATDAAATAAADTAAADAAAVEAATPLPPLDATPPVEAPVAPDVPIETPPVEAPVAPEVPTTPPVDTVPPPGELPPVETPPVDTVPPPVAPPPVETPPVETPPVETPPPETPPATEQPPGARVTDPVTGNTTTTFEDGSTLTTNAAGDVVSSTNATAGVTNPLASVVSGVKNALGAVNPYLAGAVAGQMLLGGNKQATAGNNNGYAGQAAWEWGQATPPVTPGLNPGFIGQAASVPYYKNISPTQSEYYWGVHPYAATAEDLANYNTIPNAPAVPWGQAHSAVGGTDQFNPANFVNQYITNPQYAGVNSGTAPMPGTGGPVAPGQIPG